MSVAKRLGFFLAVAVMAVLPWRGALAEDRVSALQAAGVAAFERKDFAAARSAFDEAYRLSDLHRPGLWAARSRVELGQWLEAETMLGRLTKRPLKKADLADEKLAKEQALEQLNRLRRDIPRLRIHLLGAGPTDVIVTVDREVVDASLLKRNKEGPFRRGKSLKLNPGTHRVVGTMGKVRRQVSVAMEPGSTREVSLKFPNPDTLRQRSCRDACRKRCAGDNDCYVECKGRCFGKKRK